VVDPAAGLFGLAFAGANQILAKAEVRQALAMAIDRDSIAAAFPSARLQTRDTLLPAGVDGIPAPAAPGWSGAPLATRRATAARAVAAAVGNARLELRIALPDGPGDRLLFALLRRDWAAIGVAALRARPGEAADLVLVDEVAPASLASWYLRHFSCPQYRFCDPAADQALDQARIAPAQDGRRAFLIQADGIETASALFITIAAPVRWSLVSRRLIGFRPNLFARHPAGELLASQP
jgi:oligopeptide transport system substrate-binding protein